jgi:hypothetical protein
VKQDVLLSEALAPGQTQPQALPQHGIKEFGINKLVYGGLIFIGLTLGIFWYQFSEIPAGNRYSGCCYFFQSKHLQPVCGSG